MNHDPFHDDWDTTLLWLVTVAVFLAVAYSIHHAN